MFKRLFDVVFSFIVLTFLILPIIIISIIIILSSGRPVFFLQERLGLNKIKFKLIKFRTMTNVPRMPSGEVFLDNPEITNIGRFLRRYKIDEFPQFINVLIGHMSVVGPRPCLEETYNKYKNEDTDYRFMVKPGVTSNAGVSGSIFLTWKEKWELDKKYALNNNLFIDLKIIFLTILVVIFGEKNFKKKPVNGN